MYAWMTQITPPFTPTIVFCMIIETILNLVAENIPTDLVQVGYGALWLSSTCYVQKRFFRCFRKITNCMYKQMYRTQRRLQRYVTRDLSNLAEIREVSNQDSLILKLLISKSQCSKHKLKERQPDTDPVYWQGF